MVCCGIVVCLQGGAEQQAEGAIAGASKAKGARAKGQTKGAAATDDGKKASGRQKGAKKSLKLQTLE